MQGMLNQPLFVLLSRVCMFQLLQYIICYGTARLSGIHSGPSAVHKQPMLRHLLLLLLLLLPLLYMYCVCRGIGMGIVFQLSTADCCKDYINVRGFTFGSGDSNTLLGFNVFGTAIAWGLAGLTLLENAEGSNMVLAAAQGNNVVKLIQRGLKPLDRMLGGKSDRPAGAVSNTNVEGADFGHSAMKEHAAFDERVHRDHEDQSTLAV